MKWILQYAPILMFLLFVVLASAVAAAALPQLVIPVLTALSVAGILLLGRRFF